MELPERKELHALHSPAGIVSADRAKAAWTIAKMLKGYTIYSKKCQKNLPACSVADRLILSFL